jgi:hypothetical protein
MQDVPGLCTAAAAAPARGKCARGLEACTRNRRQARAAGGDGRGGVRGRIAGKCATATAMMFSRENGRGVLAVFAACVSVCVQLPPARAASIAPPLAAAGTAAPGPLNGDKSPPHTSQSLGGIARGGAVGGEERQGSTWFWGGGGSEGTGTQGRGSWRRRPWTRAWAGGFRYAQPTLTSRWRARESLRAPTTGGPETARGRGPTMGAKGTQSAWTRPQRPTRPLGAAMRGPSLLGGP